MQSGSEIADTVVGDLDKIKIEPKLYRTVRVPIQLPSL